MRKQIVSLAAVAALALVGVGAATTTAQAASDEIKIAEVLINTNPNPLTDPDGDKIDGVELVKPEAMSLNGYQIESCDSAGTLTPVATLDTRSDGEPRTAASNQAGIYDYDFDSGATLHRDGGVRLINPDTNEVVDAVTFAPADSDVDTCLKSGVTNAPTPAEAPAPTDDRSPQRLDDGLSEDTGAFAPAALVPTFQPTHGSPN